MIRLSLFCLPCLSSLETLLTIIDNFSNKCQIKIRNHCVLGTQLSIIVQCKNWSAPERSSALFYLETPHFLRFSWSEISEKERPESGIFLGRQGHGRQGQGKNRYTILICLPKLGQAEMTCSLFPAHTTHSLCQTLTEEERFKLKFIFKMYSTGEMCLVNTLNSSTHQNVVYK